MKNVVSKVLMMFVMSFTLLVSCSYAAEFGTTGVTVSDSTKDSFPLRNYNVSITTHYTSFDVGSILGSYYSSEDEVSESIYNTMVQELQDAGYDFLVVDTGEDIVSIVIKLSAGDLGYCNSYLYAFGKNIYCSNMSSKGDSMSSSSAAICYAFDTSIIYSSFDVKSLTVLNNKAYWDGESYVYKTGSGGSSGGDSSIITPSVDTNLAGLISAITSSDVVKDNVPYANKEYFIIPYGEVNGVSSYEVYFYTSRAYLSAFEWLGSDNRLYYDLDKISVDGVLAKVFDFFNLLTGHYITIYHYSEDDNYEIIYNGEFSFDSDLLVGLDSEKNPIIYTTKDITYYYYEKDETTGEWIATPDVSKDKNNEIILDSDGNEISSFVNYLDESIGNTPWKRFLNIITSIPKKIASAFSEMLGFSKVSLFLSPLITSIAKILGVLLASISFIGRAITFVYTLPTIEASSAMFTADVETTKGLVFTGNNWGHHFLSGLTRLKNLSWNGINLWSFFEAFVLALLVIFVIKLVRKHYHV